VFAFVVAATTVVDLDSEPDALLAKMRSKTRYNVRLAQRKGIVIREGSRADMGTFHRLLTLTGERQSFTPNGLSYFDAMWDILAPGDHIKLFLAELDGEAVSAILITAFGDTAVYKRGGWSGQHGSSHPNELLHWEAMLWAKTTGYRRYDFDGIDPVAVQAIESGEPVPADISDAVVRFKLGFGGRVLMLPNYYVYIRNPLLRWCFIKAFPKLVKIHKVEKLLLGLDRT
jgi:lipid II:glycine glycyltransferase (peptidoglycan interpeptide bridge formation enzyme)